jgi:hypothetical protein
VEERSSFGLGGWGTDGNLLLDRLQAILTAATGIAAGRHTGGGVLSPSGRPYEPGTDVLFPSDEVRCIQRASIWVERENICLGAWPGELKPQYERLYSDPDKLEALIALGDEDGWQLNPNFHLAYRIAQPRQRWYPQRYLEGRQYIRQWADDFLHRRAGGRTRQEIADPAFGRWLVDRNYARPEDLPNLDDWLERLSPRIQFHIRPGVEILRTWDVREAVSRDRAGEFVTDVRRAIDQILSALDEPSLSAIRASAV